MKGWITALQADLAAAAVPAQAAAMQAYMKSSMPFLGLAAPARRAVSAAFVKQQPLADAQTLADTMRTMWRDARFREERYVSCELARMKPHPKCISMALLPVYEEMISSGAWWDHCDEISGNGLAELLLRWPQEIKPVLRRWCQGDDMWLRRASMLVQRGLKGEAFDAVLFYETLLPSIGAGPFAAEFFIRKGMGWALRERSYAAPAEVVAFCDEYAAQLSPLTVREALKVIRKRAEKS